nr:galactokinase family protein [uncultured Ruminococcus sp.]
MKAKELINQLNNSGLKEELSVLYGADANVLYTQRHRYSKAIERFVSIFPGREDVHLFSAPGRSEIGGNHTDHQRGCALGAAVNLDVVAVVAFHDEGVIRLYSEGYGMTEIDLADLDIHENEKGKSIGIVRGIAARFAQMGVKIGGIDAYSVSDVLSGTLVGTIIDVQYNDGKAGEIEIAKIGQYAENVYFGKGSGLLDQMVCSVGGFVFLDFRDAEQPVVEKHSFDFAKAGYNLCITDTKGSHSDLTDDYVAVPSEMKQVAACFGKEVLREVDEKEFRCAASAPTAPSCARCTFSARTTVPSPRQTRWTEAIWSASSLSIGKAPIPPPISCKTCMPPKSPWSRGSHSRSPSVSRCWEMTRAFVCTGAALPERSRRLCRSIRPKPTERRWTPCSARGAVMCSASVLSAA